MSFIFTHQLECAKSVLPNVKAVLTLFCITGLICMKL